MGQSILRFLKKFTAGEAGEGRGSLEGYPSVYLRVYDGAVVDGDGGGGSGASPKKILSIWAP